MGEPPRWRRRNAEPYEEIEPDGTNRIDQLGDVIMTVCSSGPEIGVAVYDRLTSGLSATQGHDDGKGVLGFQFLQLVKLQHNPSIIYVSSRADMALVDALKQPATGAMEGEDGQGFTVKLERASSFYFDQALKRLASLQVASIPGLAGLAASERMAVIGTHVNITRELQVSALGALIMLLQKEAGTSHAGGSTGTGAGMAASELHVGSLQEMTLQGYLQVDPITLSALQIFQEQRHASQMGIGKSREGCSVFGLLQRCITPMGGRLMRSWFLRPVINLSIISSRQDAVELLVKDPDTCSTLRTHLAKMADVSKCLQSLQQQMRPDAKLFKQVMGSLLQLIQLKDMFKQLVRGDAALDDEEAELAQGRVSWATTSITHKIEMHIGEEVAAAYTMVSDVIDLDQGDEGCLVAHGVCEPLDEMKATFQALPDFLTHVVEAELARVPLSVARRNMAAQQLWSVVYLPQVGYVMQVSGGPLPEDLLDCLDDYERAFDGQSDAGYVVYYKTDSCKELSHRFGDLLYRIQDLEATLCAELVRKLSGLMPALQRAAGVAAELDCLIAFAQVARERGYVRPELTEENVLLVEEGRHPLAELVHNTAPVIPNPVIMLPDRQRVHVITGPNASGKSVYCRMTALIVYMAHLGSFVPAESAVVGIVDAMYARVVNHERVCTGQSAFMTDLTQVSRMMKRATGRSLLVIDEFGKGTLSADGVGLMAACLQHLCELEEAPRVLACTHFHELFDPQILPTHGHLSYFTMAVLQEEIEAGMAARSDSANPTQPTGSISPASFFTYRLVPGTCLPSYGTLCAQMCGVRSDVVARAQSILQLSSESKPVPPLPTIMELPKRRYLAQALHQLSGLQLGSEGGSKASVAEDVKGTGQGSLSENAAAAVRLLLSVARVMGAL